MPIYEYVCDGCHQAFERYVRSWGEAVSCPRCQGLSVEKQLSRFAMSTGGSEQPGAKQAPARACCGGSCGCAH